MAKFRVLTLFVILCGLLCIVILRSDIEINRGLTGVIGVSMVAVGIKNIIVMRNKWDRRKRMDTR